MRINRIHVEESLAGQSQVILNGTAANHVSKVLRLRPGDELVLFDGRGGEYKAAILHAERKTVTVDITSFDDTECESPLRMMLLQGLSRAEKMDYTVRKATELGVHAICPVLTQHAIARLDTERAQKKLAHWQHIAIAACEQCGRNRLPTINAPQLIEEAAESLPENGARFLLNPRSRTPLAGESIATNDVVLMVGPEGGLASSEVSQFENFGFRGVCLGPRVLRTETASVAVLTVAQALWGDFR